MSVTRIFQNPIAINANRNLKVTGMNISRSLERLSSGLRINRAADDAAGLSISEKLRSQIRGLNRASLNSLDGISLIQTAEGALNEVHSILQRMRELAVQASNGIYTADDRLALQQEVSQLVDEINRISRATEFNTKSLLDGTMGALISTDDFSRIKAHVIGDVGDGGNFVMRAAAIDAGRLQIQKTDVFAYENPGQGVGKLNFLNTWRADATVTTAGADGIGNAGVYQVEVPVSANGSIAVNSPTVGNVRISGAVGSGAGTSLARNLQAEELTAGDKLLLTMKTTSGVITVSVPIVSLGTTHTSYAAQMSLAIGAANLGANGVQYYAGAGENLYSIDFGAGVSIINSQFIDTDKSGSDFFLSFSSAGVSNRFFSSVAVSFFNNGGAYSGAINRAPGDTGSFFSIGDASTGAVYLRFDTRYDWSQVEGVGQTQSDTIEWSRKAGTNSLQDYGRVWVDGAIPVNTTVLVSAASARSYAVFSFDNQRYTDLVAQGWDHDAAVAAARAGQIGATTAINSTFDGTGTILADVKIAFDGILQAGETATFNLSTNNILTGDQTTTLQSLNRFQEFGVFNGRNNAELTLYRRGTDSAVTINLSRNDTFEDMAGKISLAMWNPEGTGLVNSEIINPDQVPDLVHVNTIGAAKGTMSITTPVPGMEMVLAGDEALLKALSLVEVQDGKSPIYSISAFNLELNRSIGSIITDSDEISGLLPGLSIKFDNTLGLRLDPQPPTGTVNPLVSFGWPSPDERPALSLSGVAASFFIHVAPRGFNLQIGANQGQTIRSFIEDMSAGALGVEGLLIVDGSLAEEAISIVDVAMQRVSSQRSRLGAIQNRLESTIRNLDVAAENLTASESRIRDVDVAAETMTSTRNQILLQAGVAALAQANQLPQSVLQLLQ